MLSALALVPEGDRVAAAIVLAFLVGVVQLGIALLKLGDLTRFVSHSVILGFMLGAALLLVLDQTKHLLGLAPRGDPTDHLLWRFWLTLTSGGPGHLPTVLLGGGTNAAGLSIRPPNALLRKKGGRFPIPQHLVAGIVLGAV